MKPIKKSESTWRSQWGLRCLSVDDSSAICSCRPYSILLTRTCYV